MARIRSIHPDACDSTKLAELTSDAERLYWRLLTHCDDQGRADDNPRLIAARVAPLVQAFTPAVVDELLGELSHAELIDRYTVQGRAYLVVLQWDRFQHPRRPMKETRPMSPREREHKAALEAEERGAATLPPVEKVVGNPVDDTCADNVRTPPDNDGTPHDNVRPEGSRRGVGVGGDLGGEEHEEGRPRRQRTRLAAWSGGSPGEQGPANPVAVAATRIQRSAAVGGGSCVSTG